MIAEKAMLVLLQDDAQIAALGPVFFMEAPEGQEGAFMVLHPISGTQMLEIGVAQTSMQLDVFHADRFKAVESADSIVSLLYHTSHSVDGMFITGLSVQRTAPLKVEDGTWKVPVDIRFISKEKRV